MMQGEDVCILIPTLDESRTIGEVVDGFHEQGFTDVLVIDGGSTDDTRVVAEEHGARIVQQSGSGKGQAVQEALGMVESEYVVLVDGDGTYDPEDAPKLLEPLREGRAAHVIGDRFADMREGSMTRFNRFGNRLINRAFGYIHGRDFQDILSGYRAFTIASTERFHLRATGFGIETELAVECAKHDVPTAVVPITYRPRPEASETNLHPLRDGAVILVTLYRLAKTNNPLFYFGSLGALSLVFGGGLATYVGIEWFRYSVSHEVLAVVSGVAILFGVQLIMFGVLSDLILALHREQLRRLE